MTTQTLVTYGTVTDFINCIGVCAHSGPYTVGIYSSAQSVVGAVSYIGAANVRNAFYPDAADVAFYKTLALGGVKFDFLAPSELAQQSSAGIQAFVAGLDALVHAQPSAVMSVEGANEVNLEPLSFNGDSSLAGAAAFQQALFQSVRSDASLAGIPLLNLSVGYNDPAAYSGLTGTTGYFDLLNIHAYNTTQTDILDTMLGAVASAATLGPGKPFIITESGYTTDTAFNTLGVDEMTQAKLTIDTLLDAFAAGAQKTYLYELFDNYQSPSSPELDHHWGLFHADGTPKPAAIALHNLTSLLASPGGSAMAGTVQVSGLGSDGHSLSLAKASGATDLMLWRDTSLWDDTTHSAKSVPPEQVTITFTAVQPHVYVYSPVGGTAPIASYTNVSSITLSLSDSPLMLELGAGQSASIDAAASNPTVTMDAATLVAKLGILAQTTGISDVALTGAHILQMSSVQSMQDIVNRYGLVLAKVDGGFQFEIDSSGTNWKIGSLYNQAGTLTSTTTWAYDALGATTAMSVTNPDQSGEYDNYGVTGQSYTHDRYLYGAGRMLLNVTRYHADNTLDSSVVYNADGSRLADNYDAGGHKTLEAYTRADGGTSTLSYDTAGHMTTRQDVSAQGALTSWTYDTSGAAKTMSVTYADQSGEYDNYGVTGQSYTHDRYVYSAGRALQSVTRYHVDNTLDSSVIYNPDGSRLVDSYDATGHKTLEVYTGADSRTSTLSYDAGGHVTTRQDMSAQGTLSSWTYDTSGAAKTMSVTNADQSGEYDNYGLTGQTYTHDRYVYGAGRSLQNVTRYHADGTLDCSFVYNPDGSLNSSTDFNTLDSGTVALRGDAASIDQLYLHYEGRHATNGELSAAGAQLAAASGSLDTLRADLLARPDSVAYLTDAIDQVYQIWGGRAAAAAEVAVWRNEMAIHGATLETVRDAVLADPLGAGYTTSVTTQAYETTFARAPTTGELAAWEDQFLAGLSQPTDVGATLQAGTQVAAIDALVTQAYETFGGRDPTAAELTTWHDTIVHGGTLARLQADIVADPLGANYLNAQTTQAYQQWMGRAPSAGELATWHDTFASGGSFAQLKNDLLADAGVATYQTSQLAAFFTANGWGTPSAGDAATLMAALRSGAGFSDAAVAAGQQEGFGIATSATLMTGTGGNDTFTVSNVNDQVVEGSGSGDNTIYAGVSYTLPANVDRLILTGTANLNGTGNSAANTLIGNDGNNILTGGGGADVLTGGGGADTFVLAPGDLLAPSQASAHISDFSHTEADRIDLMALRISQGTPLSFIGSGAFDHHAGEVCITAYGSDWDVSIDLNGDGVADGHFIVTSRTGALVAQDFLL